MSEGKLAEKIERLEQQVRSTYDHYQNLAEEHRLLKLELDKAPRKIIAMNKLITLHEQKINGAQKNAETTQEMLLERKKAGIINQKADLLARRAECEALLPELGAKLISARTKHCTFAQELATVKHILIQKQKEMEKLPPKQETRYQARQGAKTPKTAGSVNLFVTDKHQQPLRKNKEHALSETKEQRQHHRPSQRS